MGQSVVSVMCFKHFHTGICTDRFSFSSPGRHLAPMMWCAQEFMSGSKGGWLVPALGQDASSPEDCVIGLHSQWVFPPTHPSP